MSNLAIKKTNPTPSQKKAKLTMKAFNKLKSLNSLDKAVQKATELIESDDVDQNAVGFNAFGKLLPYILPKQSEGNQLQVQINNNLVAGQETSLSPSMPWES